MLFSVCMWNFVWPIGLIVLSNVFYNITTKSTSQNVNPFLSLAVTYLVAAFITGILFLITADKHTSIKQEFFNLNWASFLLGVCIIGLELGYILAYRAGWQVNMAPLVASISLACVLVFVGYFLFKETLSIRQIIGVIICIAGLIFVSK